jgi:phosphoribosylamine---glycine ligase
VKVLVVGGGGREHALAWKLKRSPRVAEVIAVPGNAGITELGRVIPLDGGHEALIRLAREEGVDLTVVGPEAPLVSGLVDAFEAAGLRIFGPRQAAARLEGSKRFAKAFMDRYGVPTAHHESFDDSLLAVEHLERVRLPIVVKDSNLAAGKGVTVARTKAEAVQAARNILEAPEGGQIVIEEYLEGQELSLLAFCDGRTMLPMLPVEDYKQAHDGDQGPMTGGMGAVAPVPLDDGVMARLEQEILAPTLRGLQAEGLHYQGVLYFGLMLTPEGPKVLEYNARFGDPETQVLLPLLENDLLELMEAVIEERLTGVTLSWRREFCACVVMASPGYPESYARGRPLLLPEDLPAGWQEDVFIFHAGTSLEEGRLVTSGGRVLNVTARGPSLEAALRRVYTVVETIDFPGALYRKDIGYRIKG